MMPSSESGFSQSTGSNLKEVRPSRAVTPHEREKFNQRHPVAFGWRILLVPVFQTHPYIVAGQRNLERPRR